MVVDAVADAPSASASNGSGTAGQPIALSVSAALVDTDGSESLSVVLSGFSSGSTLSAGTDLGSGTSWELTAAQLAGLSLTTPAAYSGPVNVSVVATSTETPSDAETNMGNNTATTNTSFQVSVDPAATATASATVTETSTATAAATATATPTSTPTATQTMSPGCPATPRSDCGVPGKALLKIKDSPDNAKDFLLFKWLKGGATTPAELGDPRAATAYRLCLYSDSGQVELAIPPASPGWKLLGSEAAPKGYLYKDTAGAADGVILAKLKAGAAGKALQLLKGKGGGLPLPGPAGPATYFDHTSGVTAQLVSSDGPCWGAAFTAAPKKNTGADAAFPQYLNKCQGDCAP